MPVQVWTPGQVLTSGELTTLTNMLPYPVGATVSLTPCVPGSLYLCSGGGALLMGLPAPAPGIAIGFVCIGGGTSVTINHNAAELIFSPHVVPAGVTYVILSNHDSYIFLVSDGGAWRETGSGGFP